MVAIRDVRGILTAPAGINLVVVKVETSEPGLYGLGCATFTQRYLAVEAALMEHIRPLVIGRDSDRIEELFQLMMINGYWRNGPVLNNAISGVDMALWDLKAKRAGMPLHDLLGGRCREGAAVYRHADGRDPKEVEDNVRRFMEEGVRYVRVQCGGYGGVRHDGDRPEGAPEGAYYHPRRYTRAAVAAIEHVRNRIGDEVELLHDVHERLFPAEAVELARELEKFRLYFLEDLLAPEDLEWFANVRAVCATPMAMGELFNHPREWTPLITGRLIDFMRMHISQMGGLTPARKVAALGEIYGVRTAWHGPGDVSPVGHAMNVHLDLVCPNFGIQEFSGFSDATREVFPGCPELRRGYLYPHRSPGLGIDLDEKAAARFPCTPHVQTWSQARLPDGSLHRP
ncbi:MAG: starvation-sensing protein RspA [Planctomycetes bacterium]|nr:starvation-sensing protein RspA [Planctomycetota bacterium]